MNNHKKKQRNNKRVSTQIANTRAPLQLSVNTDTSHNDSGIGNFLTRKPVTNSRIKVTSIITVIRKSYTKNSIYIRTK